MKTLSAIALVLGIAGCAEERWLTKEEDAEMRAYCEPQGGCALVPAPIWEQIKRVLKLEGV